jgi:hypothetical protein
VAGIGFFVLYGFPSLVKNTPAFVEAMNRLRSVYETGGGGSGQEDVSIQVKGPKEKGVLYLRARRSAGLWTLRSLSLDAGGKQIDLPSNNKDL